MNTQYNNNYEFYKELRKSNNMSRKDVEIASESLLPESKLEKIENGKQEAQPDDILQMAKVYKNDDITNYYCSTVCPIGQTTVPRVETSKDLPQITVKLLSTLNALERQKDRILDIAADGKISTSEKRDFEKFQSDLREMSMTIKTLDLWAKQEMAKQ